MTKLIIGIHGKKRSGKNTTADYLQKEVGGSKVSFAKPIKEACMAIFGWSWEQVDGDDSLREVVDPYWGISPRQALLIIGTELFQEDIHTRVKEKFGRTLEFGRDIWVKRIEREISNSESDIIYITDLRFPHEVDYIKGRNGILLKVERGDLDPSKDNHISETALDNFSGWNHVVTTSCFEELLPGVDKFKEKFLSKVV